jgi:hypothetical protein
MSNRPESDDKDTRMTPKQLATVLGVEFADGGKQDIDDLAMACMGFLNNRNLYGLSQEQIRIAAENSFNFLTAYGKAISTQGNG